MPTFASYDGTQLAYRIEGEGEPLICVPGGPGRAGVYLGNLGGLDAHRQLIILDNRGTGDSEVPADPSTYRCDKLPLDIEALREHLGLETIDLLGHSAGAQVAVLYATAYPERVSRLVLVTGAHRTVGVAIDGAYLATCQARATADTGYVRAFKSLLSWRDAKTYDEGTPFRKAATPLLYGPWTEAAKAHFAGEDAEFSRAANFGYGNGIALNTVAIRLALSKFGVPTLVYAGELDPGPTVSEATSVGKCFPNSRLVVQPGAGHFPWVDDPEFFAASVSQFLAAKSASLQSSRP
ncbi:pimeloyl-ACP methyl ester carboxylesterase [Allocatelliglobosispora scoriae]|uniref:Pimeloyl-ACP methyl ester carboxylesterase n=1 Tax=Allocatelliglobosispora scoriae TaxID=643052 RepID=A0A841BQB2_9ACTN|nr:alpha/beta hydrolase [Allocatelliglobosispora scoriae]MBB5869885.1 pimeloyl-ACP methyl ester carboxylesterase [Allocatelliglobosispora scoriae]